LTRAFAISILVTEKEVGMSDATQIGDDRRLAPMDDSLPTPPDHEAEVQDADQSEPEEVPDALLDQ
jgi:hypothetical protein